LYRQTERLRAAIIVAELLSVPVFDQAVTMKARASPFDIKIISACVEVSNNYQRNIAIIGCPFNTLMEEWRLGVALWKIAADNSHSTCVAATDAQSQDLRPITL
jgi:hypothetical protein